MKLILIGLLLAELDFNLNLKAVSIDILPDSIGWLLILLGCVKMAKHSRKFMSAAYICLPLMALGVAVILPNVMGLKLLSTIMSIVGSICSLAVSYFILKGISDTEDELRQDLGYMEIWKVFCIKIVTLALAAVMQFIPYLGVVFIIADVAVSLIFIYRIFTVMKAYENHFKTEE